jgi:hypothetical protein
MVFGYRSRSAGWLTSRWSRRGCRRDEAVNGWEVTLSVITGAGHGPPRGSAPPLGGKSQLKAGST